MMRHLFYFFYNCQLFQQILDWNDNRLLHPSTQQRSWHSPRVKFGFKEKTNFEIMLSYERAITVIGRRDQTDSQFDELGVSRLLCT